MWKHNWTSLKGTKGWTPLSYQDCTMCNHLLLEHDHPQMEPAVQGKVPLDPARLTACQESQAMPVAVSALKDQGFSCRLPCHNAMSGLLRWCVPETPVHGLACPMSFGIMGREERQEGRERHSPGPSVWWRAWAVAGLPEQRFISAWRSATKPLPECSTSWHGPGLPE